MRDNFFLLAIVEGSVAGLIAFPVAEAIGSHPGFTLVLVLLLALAPGLILGPFATDFASGTHYSPNRAAQALHVADFIRGSLFVWSIWRQSSSPCSCLVRAPPSASS
jgi:MFS superfamily sulfate permease-like transporter